MAQKSQVAEAILKQLKDPFEPRLVKFRTGGGSKQLAYIDARDVMKRLDDVMGTENWQLHEQRVDGGFICELSLRIDDEWITKTGAANDTKVEPLKGASSGALKRAAVAWGVGRYLYYLPASANSSNVSEWPEWAKPGSTERWEDIAELQAEAETGMDEEESFASAITVTMQIQNAKTKEELREITESLDPVAQRLLADVIANKADELTRNEPSA